VNPLGRVSSEARSPPAEEPQLADLVAVVFPRHFEPAMEEQSPVSRLPPVEAPVPERGSVFVALSAPETPVLLAQIRLTLHQAGPQGDTQ
jgi:hypothetical protein